MRKHKVILLIDQLKRTINELESEVCNVPVSYVSKPELYDQILEFENYNKENDLD
jgi:hypothetical protein